MKPNKPGIWEWYDDTGTKQFVSVVNVECDPSYPPYFRVYFRGGYYNINNEAVGTWEEEFSLAEWPDRWGYYVGDEGCVSNEQIYGTPNYKP
jgi:hypothetical protein